MAKFLAIGAHPDDIEIGMGGTILALKAQGHEVYLLDLTDGEPTPTGTRETRLKESKEAAKILGVEERITLDLPNRFLTDSVEARKLVAKEIRRIRPDAIFLHYWVDAHPDHLAASQLAEAARFYAKLTKSDIPGEPIYPQKLFYFFSSHFRLTVRPTFIFDISPFLDKKIEAIKSYHSQFNAKRGNTRLFDDISVFARWWGSRAQILYGEPFACREPIALKDFQAVL